MFKNTTKRAQHPETIVYTPGSPILHPMRLLQGMLADLRSSFQLAYRLTVRDIAATYRQTALGYLWAVLPPLITSLTFIVLNKANVIRIENISVPYPVFVITGTVFWQLFVDALNWPLKGLNLNRAMLSRVNFPKEALIISGFGQVLFSFVIKLVLLGCVMALFKVQLRWTVVLFFLPVVGLLALGTVVGVFLVPIGMLYQDVQQALTICTSALMFFTPVLYPTPSGGMLGKIFGYNPISPFLIVCREMLFSGELTKLYEALVVLAVIMVLILVVWILYRLAMPILIERMEA
jgi:lipopolysaccharide transport system permease protein